MIDVLTPLIKKFLPFAKEKIGFEHPPKLFLRGDQNNAQNPLGKTAFYDPGAKSVTLYITGRHPKDVMRSLSHELVHHKQNCNGQFEGTGEMGEGYAQNDEHLREMEREAYEVGNMCFRDWEDGLKETIYYEHLQKGEHKMSLEDWKNNEISQLLSEAWGFKFNTLQEFDEFNGEGEIQEEVAEEEEIEERRGRGRADPRIQRGTPDARARPLEEEDDAEELEEQCPAEEEEEEVVALDEVEEEADLEEETTSRIDKLRRTRGAVEDEKEDDEKETDDLKEAIKTLLGKYLKG